MKIIVDIEIYKMRQLFYYKMQQKFKTKSGYFITKYDSYYKMRRLLQIATVQMFCIFKKVFIQKSFKLCVFIFWVNCGKDKDSNVNL